MKRVTLIVALAVLSLMLGSCSSTRYIVDRDTQQSFSGYSNYAWFELASPPDKAKPPTEANTILTGRIHRAIDNELATKGMKKGKVEDADFLVTYSLVLQSRMVMYSTGWYGPMGGWGGWGWGWGGGWTGGTTSLETYTDGTIVVDVLDIKTRKLVWRGIAESAFTKPNPDDAKIAKIVAKLMQGFPPA